MKRKTNVSITGSIVAMVCITCLTAICLVGMMMGYDGTLRTLVVAGISALGGYVYGKDKRD